MIRFERRSYIVTPYLKLWWEPREPSQADDAGKLGRFVNGLPGFDPIYPSWLRSPRTKQQVLPVPLNEAGAKNIFADKTAKYDFGGGPWPEMGSRFGAGHAGPPPYDFRKSSHADTSRTIGAYGKPMGLPSNHIFMRLSAARASTGLPWRASQLRPMMKFAREVWNPKEMLAMFSFHTLDLPEIADPTWAAGKRTLKPWIGWIAYLPPHLASRATYPADPHVETLDDGAALVTLWRSRSRRPMPRAWRAGAPWKPRRGPFRAEPRREKRD